jgi:DNA-binding transcriptional LysR family regulator
MRTASTKQDRLLGIEFRHLAALESVAESGSFGEAARRLGYSQSAISVQIAALERAAGMRLLERPGGRRAVTPTDAGERLLRHAVRAVAAMRAAEADLTALEEGAAGTLRVGTFESVGIHLFPRVMGRFVQRWPAIELRLSEAGYDDDLRAQLLGGEIELAFLLPSGDPAVESVDVLSDPYVLLAPRQSKLGAAPRKVRLREIASLPLIAYRRPVEGGEALLRRYGSEPHVVFRSDESGTVQGLVAAGIGHALVPLLTVDADDPEVVVLDVSGIPPREITLAWHADRTPAPAARAFVEVVQEVAAEVAAELARTRTRLRRKIRRRT